MRFHKADFEKLLKKSFLSFVSEEDFQSIVNMGQVIEAEALQKVPREEQPQSFLLILSGEVTLRQRGSMFEMDRIRYGHSLELRTLLLRVQQWQYEWQCETKCYFVKFPWGSIEAILQKYPLQLQYLAKITQSVALQRLKRDLLGLSISRETVINLISKMHLEKFSDLVPKGVSEQSPKGVSDLVPRGLSDQASQGLSQQAPLKVPPVQPPKVILGPAARGMSGQPARGPAAPINKPPPALVAQMPPKKMIVTISSGDVIVQINDGERPFHLKTLSAGDTTLIDWTESHLKYIPDGAVRVWAVSEDEWSGLTEKGDFIELLNLFHQKPQYDHRPAFSEQTQVTAVLAVAAAPVQTPQKKKARAPSSRAPSESLWSKLFPPSLLGSVDENRTGTALLMFLLKRAGVNIQQRDIDGKVPDDWNDTTLEAFKSKCQKVGVTTEYQDFPVSASVSRKSSVIVHTHGGFSLVTVQRAGHWMVSDFSSGSYREIPAARLQAELKVQKCLVVKGITNLFPSVRNQFKFRHVARFLKADFSMLTFLFLGGLLGFLTDLSVPVFTQYILDQVVTLGHVALLNPLILVFATISILGIYISLFNQRQHTYLSNVLALRMKAFFQSAIFKLRPNVIHAMGASQLLSRISDIDQLANFMVHQVFGSALSMIFLVGNLSVLWIYSPKLVGLVFILLPIGMTITFLMRGRIENLKLDQVRTKTKETRLILEHFSSNDDMRTLKGVLPSRWKWDFNAGLLARNLVSNQKMQALFQIIQLTGSEGVKMGGFLYAFHLYTNAQLTLGQVIAVVMMIPRVTEPIQGLVSTIYQYYSNKILITRLNDLLPARQKSKTRFSQTESVLFQKSIQFETVTLQFESESSRQIIKNVSFEVKHGDKVAFMGNTGSGKSSLAYLMAGFYEPTFGTVRYDSVTKDQIHPDVFYSNVALVEQEGRLFAGSILENIALGDERADLERAVLCAKAVVMDEDILARPGGYGSVILPGGIGLSEGQRQRLLIARALYKDPQVLILDESTSFLDPISESQVMKNVWEFMQDRTVIIFTQRIQITSRVDHVFFMENGQLLEQGSHKQLIQSKKRYFDFYLRHLSIG